MEEIQTKIDELKETMPSETYLQLCQETKRVRESQAHESLFEIKYTVNTIISTTYDEGAEECAACNLTSGLVQTKVLRGKKDTLTFANVGKEFVAGRLYIDPATGNLHQHYKPGVQYFFEKAGTGPGKSPYVTLYTIIEIKPFKNKRSRIVHQTLPLTFE